MSQRIGFAPGARLGLTSRRSGSTSAVLISFSPSRAVVEYRRSGRTGRTGWGGEVQAAHIQRFQRVWWLIWTPKSNTLRGASAISSETHCRFERSRCSRNCFFRTSSDPPAMFAWRTRGKTTRRPQLFAEGPQTTSPNELEFAQNNPLATCCWACASSTAARATAWAEDWVRTG